MSKYQFIEDVFVQGGCSEDHTTVSSTYQEDIVHWYNILAKTHSRYGSVTNVDADRIIKQIKEPNRYQAPFIIEFNDLSEKDIAGSEFILHGISETDQGGNGFDATCKLTVTKRQDHLPTDQERKQRSIVDKKL